LLVVTGLSRNIQLQVLLLTITGSSDVPENGTGLLPTADALNGSNSEEQQNDAGKNSFLIPAWHID